jgi:ABC-type transport system involved in multi-copper enzyme maturation permease subunit
VSSSSGGIWSGIKSSHVGLVARFSSKFALRTGGGLVFLLLVVLCGLSVAGIFVSPVESLVEQQQIKDAAREQGQELTTGAVIEEIAKSEQFRDVVRWVSGGDDRETDYLLRDNPALLSAFFIVLLMLFPVLACFGGFNQTSGDIQNRGLRYLLLRTERSNIFLGRFAGTAMFTVIYTAVLVGLLLLYVGFKLQVYSPGALVSWGLQGLVALVFTALPYIALCAWISAAIDSPFGSLMLCLLFTTMSWALIRGFAVPLKYDSDVAGKILPWGWKYELLSGDVGTRLAAIGMMLAFTALFLLLGLRTFHKRDL